MAVAQRYKTTKASSIRLRPLPSVVARLRASGRRVDLAFKWPFYEFALAMFEVRSLHFAATSSCCRPQRGLLIARRNCVAGVYQLTRSQCAFNERQWADLHLLL